MGAIELSRATYRKMVQNLVWATGYNLVAIPVAAGLLVPWGIDLPMAVGAIAMSLSTIIVAANAQLLRAVHDYDRKLRPHLPARDLRTSLTCEFARPRFSEPRLRRAINGSAATAEQKRVADRRAGPSGDLGWPMGLEPITFGATIRCSAD